MKAAIVAVCLTVMAACADTGPRGPTCVDSSNCAAGRRCAATTGQGTGTCHPVVCAIDKDCPAGHLCDRGACRMPCKSDNQCLALGKPAKCDTLYGGWCLPECLGEGCDPRCDFPQYPHAWSERGFAGTRCIMPWQWEAGK